MSNSNNSNSDESHAFPAYLEVTGDGTWTGHLLDLPGCVAFGTSESDVLESLRDEVPRWYRWLHSHGEPVTLPNQSPQLVVRELVRGVSPARKSGEAVALFTPDDEPATNELIDRTVTLLRYCQNDIERMVSGQPDAARNARLAPGHRSVIEIVRHIGQAECWYLTRLEPEDDDEVAALYQRVTTEEPLSGLAAILDVAGRRFHEWTTEQRSRRFVPQHNSRYGTEPWTARKVLRRFIEHRREHIDEIQRTLSGTTPR